MQKEDIEDLKNKISKLEPHDIEGITAENIYYMALCDVMMLLDKEQCR